MRRREFISLVGGATAWPLAARAQQKGKLPTIGFTGAALAVWSPWTAAFVERLGELGWIENRTITIEYRWNEGRPERIAEIASVCSAQCRRHRYRVNGGRHNQAGDFRYSDCLRGIDRPN